MENIEKIADKVLAKTSINKDQKFGSVIAIIMIIGIIINVVRVVQECEKKNTTNMTNSDQYAFFTKIFKQLSIRRGWFNSMRLKKIIRQHLTVSDYRKYKNEIENAIFETGADLSETETQLLMEAANNG